MSVNPTAAAFLAECEVLDDLVADVDEAAWRRATPAAGWDIAHQVAHLAWTDEVAVEALTDIEAFGRHLRRAGADPLGYVDECADDGARMPARELLERWRSARTRLATELEAADPSVKVPWFGPPMSPRSMATARLMETWAHAQDVADALGASREPTARLRDIAHLGIRTRDFAYRINGYEPPAQPFRVELSAPDSGEIWVWGPSETADVVRGTAEDFCLLVTQRREPEQTDLELTGEAVRWACFAQIFAGAPKSAMRGRS